MTIMHKRCIDAAAANLGLKIIVNIKNSTRDIGIYMSLGMSGFKISLIYFFQVIIMGLTSFSGDRPTLLDA